MPILKITTDGDPYPAKAGGLERVPGSTNVRATSSGVVNDGRLRPFPDDIGGPDLFVDKEIEDQEKVYNITYRAGERDKLGVATSVYPDGEQEPIGVTVNGVAIYPPGLDYNPVTGVSAPQGYRFNAVHPDVSALDQAGGRPETSNNEYRYRSNSFFTKGFGTPQQVNAKFRSSSVYFSDANSQSASEYLRHNDSSGFPSGHSKIIGWAFDGFPIYGPFGFSNPLDPSSGTVERMISSYALRSSTDIITNSINHPLTPRPNLDVYSLGCFIEDYEFLNGSGTLDRFNGRYCKTPDFLQGTYAYFLTFDNDELTSPAYPYILGEFTKEIRSF